MTVRTWDPDQPRDPDGKWGDGLGGGVPDGPTGPAPGADKLKLAGTLKLKDGERLVASAKWSAKGADGVAAFALVDSPAGLSLRVGLGGGDFEPQLDGTGRPWRGDTYSTHTADLDAAGIDQFRAGLDQMVDAGRQADADEAALWARVEKLDGMLALVADDDPVKAQLQEQRDQLDAQHTDLISGLVPVASGVVEAQLGGDLHYAAYGSDTGARIDIAVTPSGADDDWSIADASSGDVLSLDVGLARSLTKRMDEVLAAGGRSAVTGGSRIMTSPRIGHARALVDRAATREGGPLRVVAATEGIKQDGIDLRMSGAQLERFRSNPVVGFGHAYYGRGDLPIGRASNIQVDGARLVMDVEFDQGDDFARTVERKYRDGYLSAFSIGFDVTRWADGGDYWRGGAAEEWELLELSSVPVPLDAGAVVESGRALRGLSPRLVRALSDQFGADEVSAVVTRVLGPGWSGPQLDSLPTPDAGAEAFIPRGDDGRAAVIAAKFVDDRVRVDAVLAELRTLRQAFERLDVHVDGRAVSEVRRPTAKSGTPAQPVAGDAADEVDAETDEVDDEEQRAADADADDSPDEDETDDEYVPEPPAGRVDQNAARSLLAALTPRKER